ncbi:hypothetical protein OBBRIDRAFT_225383 [Obba rivulosa]|uniref:Secreted protein n=1 Tax=Obba rivulosa TaxID=1052685 RepID=A0A8E2ANE0_9APHY|nr:hypothetical protein OBBRIDRAFT_225383 [Obba rivulosa]
MTRMVAVALSLQLCMFYSHDATMALVVLPSGIFVCQEFRRELSSAHQCSARRSRQPRGSNGSSISVSTHIRTGVDILQDEIFS